MSMTMTMTMTMTMAMTGSMTGLRGTSSQAPCPGLGPVEERTPFSRMSHVRHMPPYRMSHCDLGTTALRCVWLT